MSGVVAGVVGAVVAVGSAVDSRNQRKKAAKGQERARIESAEQLAAASAGAEQDIARGADRALGELEGANAGAGLQPFADVGSTAFNQFQDQALTGQGNEGFEALIRNASNKPLEREGIFNIRDGDTNSYLKRLGYGDDPILGEISRQSNIAASAANPDFMNALQVAAQQGIAATGDIAGINARGLERQGDIQQSQAAARASALVGANPQLAQLASGANQARLLGKVGGQNAITGGIEQLAQIAGRNT